MFNGHRGALYMIVFYYAKEILGIPVRTGCRIREYFEDPDRAGVIPLGYNSIPTTRGAGGGL